MAKLLGKGRGRIDPAELAGAVVGGHLSSLRFGEGVNAFSIPSLAVVGVLLVLFLDHSVMGARMSI